MIREETNLGVAVPDAFNSDDKDEEKDDYVNREMCENNDNVHDYEADYDNDDHDEENDFTSF